MKKAIVISGANRGIGLELAREFVRVGHNVLAGVRDCESAARLRQLDGAGSCRVMQLNVTDGGSVQRFAAEVGPIDILVNNAGVLSQYSAPLEEVSLNEIDRMFQVNALGTLRVIQMLLPKIRRSSQSIIANISSLTGSLAGNIRSGKGYGYRMSKVAVNMITRSLAVDYPDIVSVSLHPGWVQTEMGGPDAPIMPEQSAAGLCRVIFGLGVQDSGRFLDFQGESLPW